MCRFVSGSLGSTVFGLVLQTNAIGIAAGFQRDLLVVVTLAGLAMLAAQALPGRLHGTAPTLTSGPGT